MSARIQLVLDEDERDAFRRSARSAGLSLSEWLRQAGRNRLSRSQPSRLRTAGDLDRFFAHCDAHDDGSPEPEWEAHLATMRAARLRLLLTRRCQ